MTKIISGNTNFICAPQPFFISIDAPFACLIFIMLQHTMSRDGKPILSLPPNRSKALADL